jgi:hypothetical protein
MIPSGTGHASRCAAVMSSASSSAPASLRPVGRIPAGGGVCGKGAARNAGASSPRPVTRSVRCAPGPRVGPALSRPAGPRCAHRLPHPPQPPPSRRVGVRAVPQTRDRPRLGRVRSLGRAAWPPAARNRGLAPELRGGEPAGQRHAARPAPLRCAPLERLHGRRGDRSSSCRLPLAPRRPFRRARSANPRANPPVAVAPCAARAAPCPTPRALRSAPKVAALRPRAAGSLRSPCAGPSPRRERGGNRERRGEYETHCVRSVEG